MGVLGANREMLAKLRAATMGGAASDIDVFVAEPCPFLHGDYAGPRRTPASGKYSELQHSYRPIQQAEESRSLGSGQGDSWRARRVCAKRVSPITRSTFSENWNSVGELWNPAYEGKLGILSQIVWQMVNAAILVGQDPKQLYQSGRNLGQAAPAEKVGETLLQQAWRKARRCFATRRSISPLSAAGGRWPCNAKAILSITTCQKKVTS